MAQLRVPILRPCLHRKPRRSRLLVVVRGGSRPGLSGQKMQEATQKGRRLALLKV